MTPLWLGVLVASLGCWAMKVAGMSLPTSVLDQPVVQRIAGLLPVGMLAALVVVEVLDAGGTIGVDWYVLAGLGAAVVALVLRAGLLTVFVVAIVTTALLRLVA